MFTNVRQSLHSLAFIASYHYINIFPLLFLFFVFQYILPLSFLISVYYHLLIFQLHGKVFLYSLSSFLLLPFNKKKYQTTYSINFSLLPMIFSPLTNFLFTPPNCLLFTLTFRLRTFVLRHLRLSV